MEQMSKKKHVTTSAQIGTNYSYDGSGDRAVVVVVSYISVSAGDDVGRSSRLGEKDEC